MIFLRIEPSTGEIYKSFRLQTSFKWIVLQIFCIIYIFIGDKIKYGICSASHLAGSIGISTRLWWTNNSKSGDVNCQSLYFFWCKSQYITFCCPSQPHWIERFKKTKEVWGCNLTSICHCVAIIGLIIRGVNLKQSRGEITQIMVWSATK